jgi:uncharacterized protein
MFYLDTSFVVAAFTLEARTEDARHWLGQTAADDVFISGWVQTEFFSALSFKIRTHQITVEERALILPDWRLFVAETAATIAIDPRDFETAAQMANHHHLGLRAGDALHIAIAQEAGCTLVTLDQKMARAALELGVPVAEISSIR